MFVRGEPTARFRAVATAIMTVLVEPRPTCLCSWSVTLIRNPPLYPVTFRKTSTKFLTMGARLYSMATSFFVQVTFAEQ